MKNILLTAGLLSALCLTPAMAQTATDKPATDAQTTDAGEPSKDTVEALKPLNCTIQKVQLCTADGCKAADAFGEMPLPAKVLVHPERRIIAGVDKEGLPHISAIQVYSQTDNDLTAQGFDGEVSWMLLADRKDDTMTFAAASDHTVMTGFGICKDIDEK